ncbi:hypothetical protein [Ramlibacter alkalitolerans]|uniref:Pilus assembly protein n=1 Tax=Ramlibacter alkalitolerans TaxID=2039631 RepID=A0ABS1JH48_9BURK|nr:hypothetical protein [Ramlibacter alkalitolerans]MBL0423545.1 hypothetical protein [Ramlibacter alkalitolerans]
MRRLQFDFQRKPAPSAAGWLLLVAGLAALAGLGQEQAKVDAQKDAHALRIAHLQAPGGAVALAGNQPDDKSVIAARKLLDGARLPWDTLFTALETAEGQDVALIAIAPDAQRRQVKIHAEARNLDAMLAFQRQLQQNPALAQVVLLDHTVMKDMPFKPVRFHILAQWGVQSANP